MSLRKKIMKTTLILSVLILFAFLANSLLLRRSDTYTGHNEEQEAVMSSLDWTLSIPNSFKEILPINGLPDRFVAKDAYHKAGIIDSKGNIILEHNYCEIKPDTIDGTFAASIDIGKDMQRWGYINQSGEWIIEPVYRDAEMFVGEYAAVQTEDAWKIINRSGVAVSSYNFLDCSLLPTKTEGIFIVIQDTTAGLYNVYNDAFTVPMGEYNLYEPVEKREYVLVGDKYNVLFSEGTYTITDIQGQVQSTFDSSSYQLVGAFKGNYVVIRSFNNPATNSADNYYGYMNYLGEIVVPPVFIGASAPVDGYAVIQYDVFDYGIIKLP